MLSEAILIVPSLMSWAMFALGSTVNSTLRPPPLAGHSAWSASLLLIATVYCVCSPPPLLSVVVDSCSEDISFWKRLQPLMTMEQPSNNATSVFVPFFIFFSFRKN